MRDEAEIRAKLNDVRRARKLNDDTGDSLVASAQASGVVHALEWVLKVMPRVVTLIRYETGTTPDFETFEYATGEEDTPWLRVKILFGGPYPQTEVFYFDAHNMRVGGTLLSVNRAMIVEDALSRVGYIPNRQVSPRDDDERYLS